jgi:small subunit ribosomal protein S3
MNFRRATKMSAQNTINAGAKGIRIEVAGRLNGAEMSRREKVIEGSVPLHTLRADIDFHTARAQTPAGIIGVKVWIYKAKGTRLCYFQRKPSIEKSEKEKTKELRLEVTT